MPRLTVDLTLKVIRLCYSSQGVIGMCRAKIFRPLYLNSAIEHKQSRSKYATPPQLFMTRVFTDHKTYTIIYFHIGIGNNMSTT